MTSTATARRTAGAEALRPLVSRAALLVVAVGAWIGTIVWARRTGNGPGTMGLGLLPFVAMWALMMTAMMLPAMAATPGWGWPRPAVSSGSGQRRGPRILAFTVGYLVVWAATAFPAYGLATAEGNLAGHHPDIATAAAAAVFALSGLYQFTPAKRASLLRCRRAILPANLQSGVRAGATFGGWCLACSWGAAALMIVFGVMNIAAMVVLAAVVFAERRGVPGVTFGRLVGAAALVGGVLVVLWPSLAAGIHQMLGM
jgi:predicted metal-binding membrane protein